MGLNILFLIQRADEVKYFMVTTYLQRMNSKVEMSSIIIETCNSDFEENIFVPEK